MFRTTLCLIALTLLASGCATARSSRFQVVDAVSGESLAGVESARIEVIWQPAIPFCYPVPIPCPFETVQTDATGLASFERPAAKVAFRKVGYEETEVESSWSRFVVKKPGRGDALNCKEDTTVVVPLRRSQNESREMRLPPDSIYILSN